jgi:arginine deiminase
VKSAGEDVAALLSEIEGVHEVKLEYEDETLCRVSVDTDPAYDPRDAIFYALADRKMPLVEMCVKHASLEDILKEHLELDKVELIKCGGGSVIDAAREQWNDGSNTFAIAPGKVVVYSRNYVTNQTLADHGIEVLTIPSSELSRGRGGPRCMTMPLVRDNI